MSLNGDLGSLYATQKRWVYRQGLATDLTTGAATVSLFTIAGGSILMLALVGQPGPLGTGAGGGATTLALVLRTATNATIVPMAAASASIASLEAEGLITFTGAVAGAGLVQRGAARGVGINMATNLQVLVPGTIRVTLAVAAGAGILNWTLLYVPQHDSVTVVAA
jgi:hypothetical protein